MRITTEQLKNKTNKMLQRLDDYLHLYKDHHFDVATISVYDFIQLLEKNRFKGTVQNP